MNFIQLFMLSTLLIGCLTFLLRRISKKTNKRYIHILSNIYQSLVSVFILSFFIIEGMLVLNISQFKAPEKLEKLDYVLVLGAGLEGEKVGNVLKSRLDEAIKYYNLYPDTQIIVSGGQGEDELIPEAVAMYNYLIDQGVQENQIIKEDKATTTLENIKFTKDILEAIGDIDKKILIVTNEFHLPRAMLIGDILGIENEGLASQTPIKVRINYMLREYPTMIIDIVRTSLYRWFENNI